MQSKNKYVEYIRENYDPFIALMLEKVIEYGFVDDLQIILNDMGEQLSVDSILGFHTLSAVAKHNSKELWMKVFMLFFSANEEKPAQKSRRKRALGKTLIMNFLYQWEGKRVEWLRGEKSVTAPLGVYCYACPSSLPCKRLKDFYNKHRLNFHSRADARKLNSKLSQQERNELFELAWDHYREKYLSTEVAIILKQAPHSYLTFFSNAINGGLSRGVKVLQQAIGTTSDGKMGRATQEALRTFISTHTDKQLNQFTLQKMADFYIHLVHRHRRKNHYKQFAKGWCNRIKWLGYKTPKVRC
jgi:lysozyme family protein